MHFTLPEDLNFPTTLTRHPRSRRISVRVHPVKRCVILNVPRRASLEKAIEFLRQKRGWVESRLAEYEPSEAKPLMDGMELVLFGERWQLHHDPAHRGVVMEEGMLRIGGRPEFLERRLRDALKLHARKILTQMVLEHWQAHPEMQHRKPSVVVREMASRWGSCTRAGRLCFNWRLVFAPVLVADYLVCHELAHLVHPNHGPRFWALVQQICPQTEEAKKWLRKNGAGLYRIL